MQYNKFGLNTACYVLTQKKTPMRDRIHWQPEKRWLFWLPADYKQKPQTDCPQRALSGRLDQLFQWQGCDKPRFQKRLNTSELSNY